MLVRPVTTACLSAGVARWSGLCIESTQECNFQHGHAVMKFAVSISMNTLALHPETKWLDYRLLQTLVGPIT